jgi:hypothetical protein
MKVYLSMGKDGRILVQARIKSDDAFGYILKYIAQGEAFNGVGFDELAQHTPGSIELPEQPDLASVQPDMSQMQQAPEAPQGAENPQAAAPPPGGNPQNQGS